MWNGLFPPAGLLVRPALFFDLSYSLRRLLTGLFIAALILWDVMVKAARKSASRAANSSVHQDMLMR